MKKVKHNMTDYKMLLTGMLVWVVLLILGTFATNQHSKLAIKNAVESVDEFYLKEIANRTSTTIGGEIEQSTRWITVIINDLKQYPKLNEEETDGYMRSVLLYYGADSMGIIFDDGTVFTTSQKDYDRFPCLKEPITEALMNTQHTEDGKRVVAIATPVENVEISGKKVVAGYICCNADKIVSGDMLTSENSKSFCRIFTDTGDNVLMMNSGQMDEQNLFDVYENKATFSSGYSLEQMRESWAKKEDGYVIYKTDESGFSYAYYCHVPGTDWVVLAMTRANEIEAQIVTAIHLIMKNNMVELTLIIVTVTVMSGIGIWIARKNHKRQELEEARHREKLQEALEREKSATSTIKALCETLEAGAWSVRFDEDGKEKAIVFSEELIKIMGFSESRRVPLTFSAFLEEVHPEDREKVAKAFCQTIEDVSCDSFFDVEFRARIQEGVYHWVHSAGQLLRREDKTPDIFYGIQSDINEKKMSQDELHRQLEIVNTLSRDYLNVYLLDLKKDHAKIIKLDGYKLEGKTERDVYYSYSEVMGDYICKRVSPNDRERALTAFAIDTITNELEEKEEYTVTYHIHEKGEIHTYQAKFARLEWTDEKRRNVIVGFSNIDHLVAEEEKQRRILEDALHAARNASYAKTTFLNNMSHDIRTPMNAIMGFSRLASQNIENPELAQNYLRKIESSSNHLLSLINDVLDMSRIESGKITLEEQPHSIKEIWQDVQTIVDANLRDKKLKLIIHTDNIRQDVVICDKLRLQQVFLNLIGNAIKFTEPGGKITFSIKQKEVQRKGYASYKFRISDTGIGISEEFLPHIFTAFSRERSSKVRTVQGTGLGLAITQNLVDMMGGIITVKSKLGEGTTFRVMLDFKVPDEEYASCGTPEAAELEREQYDEKILAEKRILLVEDNELNQEIAVALLEQYGALVETVRDGIEAVERIESAETADYDLILMDIQMPQMDGYEATRRIRNMEGNPMKDIPIVAMTANAFEEDKNTALASGMNGHVAKPIEVGKLMKMLQRLL